MDAADSVERMEDLPLASDRTRGWAALRAGGAVSFFDGNYMVTGAHALHEAAKHPEVFSSEEAFNRLGSPLKLIPIAVDPPEHARYRRLLDRFFAAKRMALLEPELRRQVGELIDGIRTRGGVCDVMAELAVPYPSQVFLTLFGLPLEDSDRLLEWKDAVLSAVNPARSEPSPEVIEHALGLYQYLYGHVTQRRESGTDDLLSELVHTRDEGGLTDEEIVGLCFLFVLAGLDTVTAALGFSFARLAADHDVRARLLADPALIPAFIEEILRIEGPVPFAPRVTTEEVVLAGVTIPKGAQVLLAYLAANRDPEVTDHPDTFDLDRPANRHFTFAAGPHRCLGSHLARMEMQLVLEEWQRRIPDYDLAPEAELSVPWPAGTLCLGRLALTVGPPAPGR